MKKLFLLFLPAVPLLFSFIIGNIDDKPVAIPPSKQRTGDAAKGYEYLTTGDYVRGGIPYNIFLFGAGISGKNYLNRTGTNKQLSHEYTSIKAPNGEVLVAPNCLFCHAQVVKDQLIIGLGNASVDYSQADRMSSNIDLLRKVLQKNAPSQYEASAPFLEVTQALAPHLIAQARGVNLADHLAALLVAHRDPQTFRWQSQPSLELPGMTIPTDTPPWWLLKKKNAMFYNGFGRGDFGRFLMASNLLTVNDTSESAEVDRHMPDVLSYIYSLKPPAYDSIIDKPLAEKGRLVFETNCSGCHGTYGDRPTYPNLLIPASIIQTDSLLSKSNYSSPQFVNWFNSSWFTSGNHPARLEPYNGYIAPPLDGIWISAPYLHNGSVPTLEALLNSKLRPECWTRNFDKPEYDHVQVGWKYSVMPSGSKPPVYNTKLTGYGNGGHYFGDALTTDQRKAVIEYLKTL